MLHRIDIGLSLIIGFAFGWLMIPVASNLGFQLGGFAFFLPGLFGVFAGLAIVVAWLLARFWPPLFQFSKFAAVGALNFALDLGVLNALIWFTGVAAGVGFVAFKAVSVAAAIINSYLWNKFWTFQERELKGAWKEFFEFLVITIVGMGVNVGAAHVVVNIIGPRFGMASAAWANVGAGASVVITLFWNFFGYKFFVFKNAAPSAEIDS